MPLTPLSSQAYERSGLAKARLVNMYVETTPEGPTDSVHRSRPGLVEDSTMGFGPIRCITTHQGLRYIVSGTRVYRDGVQIGVLAGTTRIRFAQSDSELVMVADGVAYLVTTTVATITMPDSDIVSDVAFSAGRFVYSIDGVGKYRYSEIGDATNIGDLNFATAESNPDAVVSMETLGDDLLFFGESTTEWWGPTGDTAAPFQRYNGRRYDIGSAAKNSAVRIDNGLFWVGTAQRSDRTDLRVYRTGAVGEVVSTPAIDAFLSRCADISLATAVEVPSEGRSFYVLNIPGVTTVAYDVRSKSWSEWSSYGLDVFRVQVADAGVYGDSSSNQIWTFDASANTDDGDPIERICTAFVPSIARQRISVVELYASRGEDYAGTPVVEMRYTDHENQDWSNWVTADLGPVGTFPRARWWQLGMTYPPGRVFEFRCSDDVLFAPYGLTVNEAR